MGKLEKLREMFMYHEDIVTMLIEMDEEIAILELKKDENASKRLDERVDATIKKLHDFKKLYNDTPIGDDTSSGIS